MASFMPNASAAGGDSGGSGSVGNVRGAAGTDEVSLEQSIADAPANAAGRAAQEAKWAGAVVDARKHLSNREAMKEHREVLQWAVDDFHVLQCLAELSVDYYGARYGTAKWAGGHGKREPPPSSQVLS